MIIVIIVADIHSPKIVAINVCFKLKLNKPATRPPVQAPVTGSGIPINTVRPKVLYFIIFGALVFALFSRKSTNLTTGLNLVFLKNFSSFSINSTTNGIGKKLPTIQIGNACHSGTLHRAAAISPPRSSKIGNNDTKKQNNCPFICSVSFNILINDSITFSYRSLLLKYYILIYSIYQ